MNRWILVGHLGVGEAVYWQRGGGLAVEKDHQSLVEPTAEETAEIYRSMPHLRPDSEEVHDGSGVQENSGVCIA
jgi:hypothetical protein